MNRHLRIALCGRSDEAAMAEDAAREERIAVLTKLCSAALEAGDIPEARRLQSELLGAIAARSPAQIMRMEIEKGLWPR